MKCGMVSILIVLFLGLDITLISAQTSKNVGSASDNLLAYPITE